MASKRKNPVDPVVFAGRVAWGQALQDELTRAGMERTTLGYCIPYNHPSSVNQIISGHNGMSQRVYDRICQVLPNMRKIAAPVITKKEQGKGAPGPHKKHDYPTGTQQRPPIRGRKQPWAPKKTKPRP